MNPFISWMASSAGRITRIIAGLALVLLGLFAVHSLAGSIILVVVGLVPLLAGIFDFCIFAPLFGNPFSGQKIRAGK